MDCRQTGSKSSEPSKPQSYPQELCDLAIFARREGSENARISELAGCSWATKSIKKFFEQLTQGGSYRIGDINEAVRNVEPFIDRFWHVVVPRQPSTPTLAHNIAMTKYEHRYGMPCNETFDEDKHSLQLQFIYAPCWERQARPSKHVSSFGILRDQFQCFFRRGGDIHSLESSSHSPAWLSSVDNPNGRDFHMPGNSNDESTCSDISDDIFLDAHECSVRKRRSSVESHSPVPKVLQRK